MGSALGLIVVGAVGDHWWAGNDPNSRTRRNTSDNEHFSSQIDFEYSEENRKAKNKGAISPKCSTSF